MLQDENTQIFYCLQTLLTKANIAKLSLFNLFSPEKTRKSLSPLYQILIYETYVLPQLC